MPAGAAPASAAAGVPQPGLQVGDAVQQVEHQRHPGSIDGEVLNQPLGGTRPCQAVTAKSPGVVVQNDDFGKVQQCYNKLEILGRQGVGLQHCLPPYVKV